MSSEVTPLLTISIPTYNRAPYLRELLDVLLPQIQELQDAGQDGEVELLISDNASTDETPEITEWALSRNLPIRVFRQPENIGPDRNFVYCFRQARGRYFWVFGDDDILRPGGLEGILQSLRGQEDYDLVFLTPFPFRQDWQSEFRPDPWGRTAKTIRSSKKFTRLVNIDLTFITAYIVNRQRLLQVAKEAPEDFVGTHLVQLSWTLPLLRQHRQSLVLWQHFVGGRVMNSGGYNVAEIFGQRFLAVVQRLLPDRTDLAAIFPNFALRRWFPATLLEIRQSGNKNYDLNGAEVTLRGLFFGNFRFWLYTWPVLRLPLRMAVIWQKLFSRIGRLVDWLQSPGESFWKIRTIIQRRKPTMGA